MPAQPTSNPAQRLHEILQRYQQAFQVGKSYDGIWTEVLDVSKDGVTSSVAGAIALIPAIEQAVAITDDAGIRDLVLTHRDAWSRPFVPRTSGRDHALDAGSMIDQGALVALNAVSSHLRVTLPEGKIPDAQATMDLYAEVQQLIEDLRNDSTIPDDLRSVMIARLHDMAWALDHVAIGGAGAIQSALERLLLTYGTVRNLHPDKSGAEAGDVRANAWDRIKKICVAANEIVSAPGAWYSTGTLVGPYLTTALTAITSG